MGLGQFLLRHADGLRREVRLVDSGRIVEHGGEPLLLHVAADPLDDLYGGKRLAEHLDRQLPARLADDVSLWAEPPAEFGHRRADVVPPAVDAEDVQFAAGHAGFPGSGGWEFECSFVVALAHKSATGGRD